MEENNIGIDLEKMSVPSYKLLVTTPMAAIMLNGKENSEWSGLLESIGQSIFQQLEILSARSMKHL